MKIAELHSGHKAGFWGERAAGCIFFARETKRFMLALRSIAVEEPLTWGTWGGALDAGETPEAAVTREVREETGYQRPLKLVPLAVFKHESGFQYHNFACIVSVEFKPKLNWETYGYKWFELGSWPEPLHPGVAYLRAASLNELERLASLQR